MTVIHLENDIKITTFPPPSGFDPLTASALDVERAGFPSRPTDPKLLERYQSVFNVKDFHYIEPTFRVDSSISTRPNRVPKGTQVSPNWSGGVVYAPSGHSFESCWGTWVTPNVYPPTQNKWYHCLIWIGLDGFGGQDVCQAGVYYKVFQSGNSFSRVIYPFHEWFPAYWVEITNLAIDPGDLINLVISTGGQGAGSTTAMVYFTNQSSSIFTFYQITAPSGTQLAGDCAEWIVETPVVDGVMTDMANYGNAFFSGCLCRLEKPHYNHVHGGTGDSINLERDGMLVSTGSLITPDIIRVLFPITSR